MSKSILMTGHRGVVGSILVPGLSNLGYEITGYDIKDGDDIHDVDKLSERLVGKDACVHLAGIPGPTGNTWEEFVYANVEGTNSVIKACHNSGVKRLVYMSSGAVYGFSNGITKPAQFPIREDNPLPPTEELLTYDRTKILCEGHLEEAAKKYKMTTIALRLETPFPHASIIESHFFVSITEENLVEALRASLEAKFKGFGAFNIGDPIVRPEAAVNVQDWIKIHYPDIPNYTVDQQSLYDITKAREVLGYSPR